MLPILFYLLKVLLVSGILTGYYWLSLRNKKFHYYNRFYLLACLLLSWVLPLLNFQWFSLTPHPASPLQQMTQLLYVSPNNDAPSPYLEWPQLLLIGYALVAGILLLILLSGIIKLFQIKSKAKVTPMQQFDFIETSLDEAPFSFFRNLFWRKDISLNNQTGQRMLQHELAHIVQLHSADKIFASVSTSICWINPFFWLIRRELEVVHEFIADEAAISGNDATTLAEMLLTAHYSSTVFSTGQSFFYSSIKRRIIMLTSSPKTSYSYARRLLILPLSLAVIALLSFTIQGNSKENSHKKSETTIQNNPSLDTIPAQFLDEKTGKIKGSYQIDIKGDTALFKDMRSKKLLFNVPLSQLGEMNGKANPMPKKILMENNKLMFVVGDTINVIKGSFINEKGSPRIIIDGKEITSTAAINAIPPSSIKNIKITGSEMNLLTDSSRPAAKKIVLENSTGKKVYTVIAGKSGLDTITVENITLEKHLQADNVKQGATNDPETILVVANDVDGKKMYTIKKTTKTEFPSNILYVVDGIETDAASIKNIDPNAIRSMNVLKGSPTSKYGDKGKNGVIEIVTKK